MRPCAFIVFVSVVAAAAMPHQAVADEDFSVVINGRTGATLLRNDSNTPLELDGYLLRSPNADVFDPADWDRLENNVATPGWLAAPGAADRIGEGNLFGSTLVSPGATLPLGSPYLPFAPAAIGETEPGLGTIEFSYSTPDGLFAGDVEFISRNTVVLVVDRASGAASLQNQSTFGINIDSYLIKSTAPAPVLDPSGWTPLENSISGWTASTGAANRIAEGNLFGSTFLAPNATLQLGEPIDPALLDDETDLELEYTVAGLGSIFGGVLFATSLPGDYNGDGAVNAADFTVWRDRLGQNFTLNNVNPDALTPNIVDQEDYDFWKSRFGMTAGSGFGGGGLAGPATTVPEPATIWLVSVCVLGAIAGLRTRCIRRGV